MLGSVFSGVVAAVPNPETDGVSNLAACYSQNKFLAVELVIDESQSLRSTDPDGRRVELARAITEAMAQISTVPLGGQTGRIDFQVVGFGTQTAAVVPWQTLDRSSADAIVAQVESFRDRDDQLDTDYVDALSSARSDVLQRAAEMRPENPSGVCRAVFWFSDGKFDFEPHGIQPWWAPGLSLTNESRVREAVERGTRVLCEPNGIADQYRSSETYLLTAALLSPGFNQDDEALLRNVTEGGGGCGALPGRPTGTYFSAEDVDRLVRLIVPPVIGDPTPPEIGGTPTNDGSLVAAFPVDGATVGVNLFVEALPRGEIQLIGPGGGSLDLTPPAVDGKVDGVPVSSRAAGATRLATLDFSEVGASADGTWTVRFTPEGAGELTIWVARQTGISLSPVDPVPWTRGEPGSAAFQVVDSAGAPLAATDLASVALQGRVVHGDETVEAPAVLTPGTSEVTLTATPSRVEPASAASIDVSGTVTTAAGDQIVVSAATNVPVNVAGAPVPESINLGVITPIRQKERDAEGRQPVIPVELERTVTVTAASDSDGVFCLPGDSSIEVHGQAVRISPSGDECVRVAAGASAEIPVSVAIDRPVDGTIAGSLAATTRSELQQEASPVAIVVNGEIVVPPGDPVVVGETFWMLVLGSLVVAGGLWIGLSWWTSRFRAPTLIAGFRVPVTIRPATSEFSMPPMDPDKWEYLKAPGPRSVLFEDLEITAPVRIFHSQDAIVERSNHIAHGNQGAAGHRSSLKGRIAHQIQGQWVFTVPLDGTVDALGSEISGELYFFVLGDAVAIEADGGGLMERAKQELSARLPDIVERVKRHAPPEGDEPPIGAGSSGGAEPGSGGGFM